MNKRLMDAYDRMTMPDACARRIEGQLECQLRERKKGRYTRIQPPEPKTNWWAVGAALVCLVLAVSVGGTFLMMTKIQKQWRKKLINFITYTKIFQRAEKKH